MALSGFGWFASKWFEDPWFIEYHAAVGASIDYSVGNGATTYALSITGMGYNHSVDVGSIYKNAVVSSVGYIHSVADSVIYKHSVASSVGYNHSVDAALIYKYGVLSATGHNYSIDAGVVHKYGRISAVGYGYNYSVGDGGVVVSASNITGCGFTQSVPFAHVYSYKFVASTGFTYTVDYGITNKIQFAWRLLERQYKDWQESPITDDTWSKKAHAAHSWDKHS